MTRKLSVSFMIFLALVIALSFLVRTIYWFYFLSIDGGINLREPNPIIASIELILVSYSFIVLFIYFIAFTINMAKQVVRKNG